MAHSVYIATSDPQAGKSLVTLGLIELSLRKTAKTGIFRPIINKQKPDGELDNHLNLILTTYNLNLDFEECYAYTKEEANELLGHGKSDNFIEQIISKYKDLEKKCDFVLIEGTDFLGDSAAFEFDMNAFIAKNLGAPVLIVENGHNPDAQGLLRKVNLAIDSYTSRECHILGVVMNRLIPETLEKTREIFSSELNSGLQFFLIPENEILRSPTIREIADHLDAEILYGADKMPDLAFGYTVAAMQIQNFLEKLKEKHLIITPGDRADIISATLQANQSSNYPNVAGFVLTGGLRPAPSVVKILDGLNDLIPILLVQENTFETTLHISGVRTKLRESNHRKIKLSQQLFEKYFDIEKINEELLNFHPRGMTPKMFNYNLTQMAKSIKKHIVLPEATDERILKATEHLLASGIVKITLLGEEDKIRYAISNLGLKIKNKDLNIVDPQNYPKFESYVKRLYKLRKHKGLSLEMAHDLMGDVSYFGTMMVYLGHADGLVSGAVHTTQHTIRPAMQFVKTKPGYSVISSVFFMCLDDRVLVYGDCAVNPNPNAEQLAEIAISSAETSEKFGIEPRIAMLSYSSGESGKGDEVEKVRKATRIVKKMKPELLIEGPIQYDAAVDTEVGRKKMPGSKVAGKATVLIFPDLNTGNNTYKAVQRETGAIAIGPVLQGLNKPVNDLSRGCTVEDVINTVTITAIQAQME